MTRDLVHVWVIRLDPPPEHLAGLEDVLDDDERARAAALTQPAHRQLFTVAHGAVRIILGDHLGVPPGQIRWQHGPKGKPELAGPWSVVQVSQSHSGGLAALAIAAGRRVGVDVQQFPASLDPPRMAGRFYPPDEAEFVTAGRAAGQLRRFIRLWTRKEACVKVTGGVLMQGMRLPVRGRGRVMVYDPDGPLPGPYLVQDIAVPQGLGAMGAVAAEGAADYDVERHWWPYGTGQPRPPAIPTGPDPWPDPQGTVAGLGRG